MTLETLLSIGIPATFLIIVVLERLAPARPMPRVAGWRALGVGFFLLTGFLSTVTPLLWIDWISAHRLLDLSALGTLAGGAIAFVVSGFLGYGWHRALHRTSALWRIHQLHHSAERVDVYGSAYIHPVEIIGTALVRSLGATLILGVTADAAALAGFAMVVCATFQHANIRTPRWLGYLVQRPEAHSVHHARGVHAFNYANLSVVDMLFGTFRNPEHFEADAGFWDGASRRVGAMLVGRDNTTPPVATDDLGMRLPA